MRLHPRDHLGSQHAGVVAPNAFVAAVGNDDGERGAIARFDIALTALFILALERHRPHLPMPERRGVSE